MVKRKWLSVQRGESVVNGVENCLYASDCWGNLTIGNRIPVSDIELVLQEHFGCVMDVGEDRCYMR